MSIVISDLRRHYLTHFQRSLHYAKTLRALGIGFFSIISGNSERECTHVVRLVRLVSLTLLTASPRKRTSPRLLVVALTLQKTQILHYVCKISSQIIAFFARFACRHNTIRTPPAINTRANMIFAALPLILFSSNAPATPPTNTPILAYNATFQSTAPLMR